MWQPKKMSSFVAAAVLLTTPMALAGTPFTETFETLTLGQLDGTGGWHGWGGSNTTFATVSNAQNHTPAGTKSVRLAAGADSVTELSATTGHWIIRTWVFCPTGFIGKTYFIVMNTYADPAGPFEWGAQIGFNGDSGRLECDCGTTTPAQAPLVINAWAELVIDVDLATGVTSVYYNGNPTALATYQWTNGVFGQDTFASISIDAIDLYPDAVGFPAVTPIFMDDISVEMAGPPDSGTPICFGATGCPCLNDGTAGSGCANGTGGGGVLGASGTASITADTLSLTADGVINNNGLFFQGNNTIGGGAGVVFGDGIRCCGGSVVRIQVVNPPGSTSPATAQMTETATTNGPNGTIVAGGKKCYQFWYRDPATSPCGSQFNLTNAVTVTWIP